MENEGMNCLVPTKVMKRKNQSGSEPEPSNRGDGETDVRNCGDGETDASDHGEITEQQEHGYSNEVMIVEGALKESHSYAIDKKAGGHDCNTQQ